jgi:hypothetical protein
VLYNDICYKYRVCFLNCGVHDIITCGTVMCHNPEHYHLNFLHCEYLNIFVLFLGRGKTEGPTMQ